MDIYFATQETLAFNQYGTADSPACRQKIKTAANAPEGNRELKQAEAGEDSTAEQADYYFPGVKTYDPSEFDTYEEY